MGIKNCCQLITYPDSLGGNFKTLADVLIGKFPRAVTGVHILPFYPSSADRGFAPLTLQALYEGNTKNLKQWFSMCPRKQITALDTHDGIGVVDVADLMTAEEIERTKNNLFEQGANLKRRYNTAAYNNLDIYQINCTYYSALNNDDKKYLLARAVQFFTPGVPHVYYAGLIDYYLQVDYT